MADNRGDRADETINLQHVEGGCARSFPHPQNGLVVARFHRCNDVGGGCGADSNAGMGDLADGIKRSALVRKWIPVKKDARFSAIWSPAEESRTKRRSPPQRGGA
jgi:hypothetical protein